MAGAAAWPTWSQAVRLTFAGSGGVLATGAAKTALTRAGTGGQTMTTATNAAAAKLVTLLPPTLRHPGNSHEDIVYVEAILEEVDGR